MITYTDLVTLLLTFFVLLISMSVIAEEKRVAALSSVIGAFGAMPGGNSGIGSPKGENFTDRSAPMESEKLDLERMRNLVSKNGLQSEMSVVREEERIIISLNDRLVFRPKSSRIDPERIRFLNDLKDVLTGSSSRIELRGYADPAETVLDPDRLKPALMLSARRALAIFHFLADGGEIPTERIVAHGFGNLPAENTAPSDLHQRNRQVQIIMDYREKLPFRLTKPAKNPFLDFKGFFFKVPGGEGAE